VVALDELPGIGQHVALIDLAQQNSSGISGSVTLNAYAQEATVVMIKVPTYGLTVRPVTMRGACRRISATNSE